MGAERGPLTPSSSCLFLFPQPTLSSSTFPSFLLSFSPPLPILLLQLFETGWHVAQAGLAFTV